MNNHDTTRYTAVYDFMTELNGDDQRSKHHNRANDIPLFCERKSLSLRSALKSPPAEKQKSYRDQPDSFFQMFWCGWRDSNSRPTGS